MKTLASCPVTKNEEPSTGSVERIAALVLIDAALPIKVVGMDASADCDSVLPENARNCALWVYYTIENVTDDVNFTSVAVACLGALTNPPNIYRLANARYDPIISSGRPLGPHESLEFNIWYGVGHLGIRFNRTQVIQGGSSQWCHVLAARAEPLPGLNESISDPKFSAYFLFAYQQRQQLLALRAIALGFD